MIIGSGGTGKSVLVKAQELCFNSENVCTMPDAGEKIFGAMNLIKQGQPVWFVIFPEVTRSTNFSRGFIQGLLEGRDTLVIARKNKPPWEGVPGCTVFCVGNEFWPFPNDQGQISRRKLMVRFNTIITSKRKDEQRLGRISGRADAYLLKELLAYKNYVVRHGSKDPMTVIPHYFRRTEKYIEQSQHPLEAFIEACRCREAMYDDKEGQRAPCPMKLKANYYIREKDFLWCLKKFCEDQNYPMKTWQPMFYEHTFAKHKLQRCQLNKAWPPDGDVVRGVWICGVGPHDRANFSFSRANATTNDALPTVAADSDSSDSSDSDSDSDSDDDGAQSALNAQRPPGARKWSQIAHEVSECAHRVPAVFATQVFAKFLQTGGALARLPDSMVEKFSLEYQQRNLGATVYGCPSCRATYRHDVPQCPHCDHVFDDSDSSDDEGGGGAGARTGNDADSPPSRKRAYDEQDQRPGTRRRR